MRIKNNEYILKNKKIKNKLIVLISDIHYYKKEDLKRLNKVLDEIKKINPNYICISGDITDRSNVLDEDIFVSWLEELAKVSKVMCALGNHEYYFDIKNKIFSLNQKLLNKIKNIDNLYLLDNENIVIDNINFIGLNLPINFYGYANLLELKNMINKLKTYKTKYNILLCHSPAEIVKEEILKDINADLILCGHMHGGLMPNILRPIIKNAGLISPRYKLFPKECYGHINKINKDIIISSGITILSHENKFRLLNFMFASEIVKIRFN